MVRRGQFIIVEGDDYAGKTTFIKYLKKKHPEFVYNREPGGSPESEKIRELLLSESGQQLCPEARFHLFWASRFQNLNTVIRPAVQAGQVVISDRFDVSTFAYQVGGDGGRHLTGPFWRVREQIMSGLAPSYLFFEVDSAVAEARRKTRPSEMNHFDRRGREYRARVKEHYKSFADWIDSPGNLPQRAVRVDANANQRTVTRRAYRGLLKLLEG